jgi:hypothetical protein
MEQKMMDEWGKQWDAQAQHQATVEELEQI